MSCACRCPRARASSSGGFRFRPTPRVPMTTRGGVSALGGAPFLPSPQDPRRPGPGGRRGAQGRRRAALPASRPRRLAVPVPMIDQGLGGHLIGTLPSSTISELPPDTEEKKFPPGNPSPQAWQKEQGLPQHREHLPARGPQHNSRTAYPRGPFLSKTLNTPPLPLPQQSRQIKHRTPREV